MITIKVQDRDGREAPIEIPADINLSLMEILKAYGYPIAATCGGLALCATCHIEILHGAGALPEPGLSELDILETLPDQLPGSRLACQLRSEMLKDGLELRIMPES